MPLGLDLWPRGIGSRRAFFVSIFTPTFSRGFTRVGEKEKKRKNGGRGSKERRARLRGRGADEEMHVMRGSLPIGYFRLQPAAIPSYRLERFARVGVRKNIIRSWIRRSGLYAHAFETAALSRIPPSLLVLLAA